MLNSQTLSSNVFQFKDSAYKRYPKGYKQILQLPLIKQMLKGPSIPGFEFEAATNCSPDVLDVLQLFTSGLFSSKHLKKKTTISFIFQLHL